MKKPNWKGHVKNTSLWVDSQPLRKGAGLLGSVELELEAGAEASQLTAEAWVVDQNGAAHPLNVTDGSGDPWGGALPGGRGKETLELRLDKGPPLEAGVQAHVRLKLKDGRGKEQVVEGAKVRVQKVS